MRPAILILDGGDSPFTTEDFLNKLFPNFWSFLINLLALIVLFALLYFIAYKPVKKYLKAREDHVERTMRDAEAAKAINERKAAEADGVVEEAHAKAAEIVEKAREDASKEADRIASEAKEEAERRLRAADEDIASSVEKAKAELHDEIIGLAIDASKEALGKSLDPRTEKALIASFEDDLGDRKK